MISYGNAARKEVPELVANVMVPPRSGSREQARELVRDLPEDLRDSEVVVDCGGVFVATPSFIDEVVKIVLVEREATLLRLLNAPERTASYALRAADARDVAQRLDVSTTEIR